MHAHVCAFLQLSKTHCFEQNLVSRKFVYTLNCTFPSLFTSLFVACKASQENSSPRITSSRENCNFRRKQSKPEKAAQLMRELTNLVSHSSMCSGRKEKDHHDNGDFELNGVVDCPEVLAELLDTRYVHIMLMCVLYVCTVCMYCMYILYVCTVCMYCMYVLYVYTVCMYCMYVLYVCTVCMYCMYVLYVCTVCMCCMYVLYVCTVCMYCVYVLYVCTVCIYCMYVRCGT